MSGITGNYSGSAGDSRMTPQWLVDELANRYTTGGFVLDVCATGRSTKATFHYGHGRTGFIDGLTSPWGGQITTQQAHTEWAPPDANISLLVDAFFCNPPWSDITPWVEKGIVEVYETKRAEVGVFVLPARLSSAWWPDLARWAEVLKPIRGRVQFPPEDPTVKSSSNPEATVYAVLRRDIIRPEDR